MDLQAFIHDSFAGKRVIVVGNAPFSKDRSQFIDSHDVVIRFNQFSRSWFRAGLSGRRIDCWFNNLVRDRETKAWRAEHCQLAKELNSEVIVASPHEDDNRGRLKDACDFYEQHGLELTFPAAALPTPFLSRQPSTGFYTAFRILRAGIPVAVIGFTGHVSKHHDGKAEMAFLQSQCPGLVALESAF